jgi:hypothetical protein
VIGILFILLFALAAISVAIYRLQRSQSDVRADRAVAPPTSGGLFDDYGYGAQIVEGEGAEIKHARLLERAARGDKDALTEAQKTGDGQLYSEVLDSLVEAVPGQEAFRAIVTHISQSDGLRANVRLAERVIDEWKPSSGRRATVEMLHVAAISDDAATYEKAVEMALRSCRSGELARFSADELCDLVESQYWLLAPEARASGAGFRLKQRFADIRRELATATPAK